MASVAVINEEVSVLIGWNDTNSSRQTFTVPDTTELVLAVGVEKEYGYRKNEDWMKSCGFKQNSKSFVNPNTNRSLTFLAAERQDLNERVFSFYTPRIQSNFLQRNKPWQYFPACCGLVFLTDPLSINKKAIERYPTIKIGLICIVENSQQKEIDHLINEFGFVPAYYLSTKTIFYKHFSQESLS